MFSLLIKDTTAPSGRRSSAAASTPAARPVTAAMAAATPAAAHRRHLPAYIDGEKELADINAEYAASAS